MYRNQTELSKLTTASNISLREAVRKMDDAHQGIIMFVESKGSLSGILTDADLRRLMLNSVDMSSPAVEVMNKSPKVISEEEATPDRLKKYLIDHSIMHLPVVDNANRPVDVVFETDFFRLPHQNQHQKSLNRIPVVVMAGGKGSRLDPFTRVLPKPLIPIGNQTILEIIMARFADFGVYRFYLSINHKGNMIKAFLSELNTDYEICYLEEKQPLGTAGSLGKLKDQIDSPFFLSNCDILVETNFSEIYSFHSKHEHDVTLVASMQSYTVPYGVCEIASGGLLQRLREKPQIDFLVNTGLYLFNPAVLRLLPEEQACDMPELIKKAAEDGLKIGVFPVSEKSWIDIGQWEEYHNTVRSLQIESINRQR